MPPAPPDTAGDGPARRHPSPSKQPRSAARRTSSPATYPSTMAQRPSRTRPSPPLAAHYSEHTPWPLNRSTPAGAARQAHCRAGVRHGDHSVAYTRRASAGGRLPRFLDGATLARVPPSGAAACLLAAEWQAHTQHSAEPWRRLLVAWASTQLSSEVTTSASTTPPSQRWPMFRHVPARRRHACSTRACLARSLRLSVCNIMASLHTTATFPGKVKLHSRRLLVRV